MRIRLFSVLILLNLALCFEFNLKAQSLGTISGTVTDRNQQGLSGLTVSLNDGLRQTVTDSLGRYLFDQIQDGSYTVKVKYFDQSFEEITQLQNAENRELNLILDRNNQQLEAANVAVNRKAIPSSTLRLSENLLVTPQNIQILDNTLLNDQMILNTAEGFARNVSGVRTVLHQENASASINVRGYRASNLRNGMDVSGSFGPLREDVSFIERIEFVKGPAGFMMGNTQPGGFYNIVTKKPQLNPVNTARITLGSFGLYRGEVDFTTKLSEDGKLLGRFNLMGTQMGSHRNYTENEQYVINPSFRYLLSDKTDLTLEYIYSQNGFTGGFSQYSYGLEGFREVPQSFTFNDPIIAPTVIQEHNIYAAVNHLLSDNWMLTGQLGYINSAMEGESVLAFYNSINAQGDLYRHLGVNDALNTSVVGQVFTRGHFNIGEAKNQLLAGLDMGTKTYVADWTHVTGPNGQVDTLGGAFNIYNPVYGQLRASDIPVYDRSKPLRERGAQYLTEYTYYSVHLQDELHLLQDRLRLGAGLRYTNTSRTSAASNGQPVENSALTPRFSVTGLLSSSLTVFALYDQAFQEQTGILLSGEPAKPSRGVNAEVGLKKAWFGGNLLAGITAYHLTRTNVTTSLGPDNPGFIEQSGEAVSKGVEVDINGRMGKNWNLIFNYSLMNAQITEDNDPLLIGRQLQGTAKHISNAWLHYTFQQGAFTGLGFMGGYQFENRRAAWPVTPQAYLPDNLFFLNLGVNYRHERINISALVNNVTNRYNYTGHYPGAWGYSHYGWIALPPTNFRLSLTYLF